MLMFKVTGLDAHPDDGWTVYKTGQELGERLEELKPDLDGSPDITIEVIEMSEEEYAELGSFED
jgi:hypothetical protein